MTRLPRYRHSGHYLWILLSLILLGGCAGNVIISKDYPDPVVAPLPYRVGVYFNPEFRNYVYSEEEADVEFEVGTHQTRLFEKVMTALFLQSVSLSTRETSDTDLDLVIEPVLQEYAFLSPLETATDFYAVSLKYQLRLYSADGEIVGFWPFVAYGKSRTRVLAKNESLGDATTMALRDAAAAMVSQFRGIVQKEEWKTASVTQ